MTTITRRQALEAGALCGAMVALGAGNAAAQTGPLIQKRIPKTGEMLPAIGMGTNSYGVGTSEEERAPLRDTMARESGMELLVYHNPEAMEKGINPFDHGALHTDMWKTEGLKQGLDKWARPHSSASCSASGSRKPA